MLAELTPLFSGVMMSTAIAMALLSVCAAVYTAGRTRGQLDSHSRRIAVLEKEISQLTKDIYARLGSLEKCLVRVTE